MNSREEFVCQVTKMMCDADTSQTAGNASSPGSFHAAVKEFSEKGFQRPAPTDVAPKHAGVNQGLITYYFKNKDSLWKAAAGSIFDQLRESAGGCRSKASTRRTLEPRHVSRSVSTSASPRRIPELFRLLVEEGKRPDARMRWLVDTYMKPFYEQFQQVARPRVGRQGLRCPACLLHDGRWSVDDVRPPARVPPAHRTGSRRCPGRRNTAEFIGASSRPMSLVEDGAVPS